jgi:hypothetical protein
VRRNGFGTYCHPWLTTSGESFRGKSADDGDEYIPDFHEFIETISEELMRVPMGRTSTLSSKIPRLHNLGRTWLVDHFHRRNIEKKMQLFRFMQLFSWRDF